jgi:hypothetical protein
MHPTVFSVENLKRLLADILMSVWEYDSPGITYEIILLKILTLQLNYLG